MPAFVGKAWFRAQLAPYLQTIKTAIASGGGGGQLAEYVDSNPENPTIGQQWVRLDTIAPAHSPTHLAPLGLMQNRASTRFRGSIKTQTTAGVIES